MYIYIICVCIYKHIILYIYYIQYCIFNKYTSIQISFGGQICSRYKCTVLCDFRLQALSMKHSPGDHVIEMDSQVNE